MSLKKLALAACMATAGLAASQATLAQTMPERGWYVGGSLGQMEADGSCPGGFSCDFKDSSWKIFGGYRINRNFAAEGFYTNWGEISARSGVLSSTVEQTSFGIAGLGILPLGAQFEIFGKLGIAHTEQEASGTGGFTASDSGRDFLLGFGAGYSFTRNFAVRAEWERMNDSEVNALWIGLQYRF